MNTFPMKTKILLLAVFATALPADTLNVNQVFDRVVSWTEGAGNCSTGGGTASFSVNGVINSITLLPHFTAYADATGEAIAGSVDFRVFGVMSGPWFGGTEAMSEFVVSPGTEITRDLYTPPMFAGYQPKPDSTTTLTIGPGSYGGNYWQYFRDFRALHPDIAMTAYAGYELVSIDWTPFFPIADASFARVAAEPVREAGSVLAMLGIGLVALALANSRRCVST